jgi:hypothetical protein
LTALVAGLILAQSAVPREIGAIRFLVGDWTGSVSGANVSFGVAQGPGGRSLKFSLRVSGALIKPFSDEGFIWWDKEAAAYRSHAMSSVSNEPRIEIGRIANGGLVMVSEPFEVSGISERTRRTFIAEGDGLRMKLDVRDGDSWKPGFSTLLKKRR